jgi:hypothetical protein
MEPKDSLFSLKNPPLVPILSQINVTQHPCNPFLGTFYYYHPICAFIFLLKSWIHISSVSCRTHLTLWFYHPNICQEVHIMKLFNMQFSLTSFSFIHLRSKYCPQHLVLKHTQSTWQTKFHTLLSMHKSSYISEMYTDVETYISVLPEIRF